MAHTTYKHKEIVMEYPDWSTASSGFQEKAEFDFKTVTKDGQKIHQEFEAKYADPGPKPRKKEKKSPLLERFAFCPACEYEGIIFVSENDERDRNPVNFTCENCGEPLVYKGGDTYFREDIVDPDFIDIFDGR
jgi:hypothetical protein